MTKEYWPTNDKIERLREAGIFSYSNIAVKSFLVVVLSLILYFLKDTTTIYFEDIKKIFYGTLNFNKENFIKLFLFIPFIMFLSIVAITLAQSRFLIMTKNIIHTQLEINLFKENNIILKLILFYLIFLSAYFILFYVVLGENLSILNNDYKEILSLIRIGFNRILLLSIIFFGVLGVVSFCFNKFLFLYNNRMTKEEFQNETRCND